MKKVHMFLFKPFPILATTLPHPISFYQLHAGVADG